MDYQASSPMDPAVVRAVTGAVGMFGNPSSGHHAFGQDAKAAMSSARAQIASLIGAESQEIVFTSGATEANNLALRGLRRRTSAERPLLLVSAVEHPSVARTVELLARHGWRVAEIPVDSGGRLIWDHLEALLEMGPMLVSVMAANNEIGTVYPLREIGELVGNVGALFHVDATQGVGSLPIDVDDCCIDLLSLSGHKLCGPMGSGALYVRSGAQGALEPLQVGGDQERGLRSGTENVPGIVGLGKACELVADNLESESARVRALRARLYQGLSDLVPDTRLNGPKFESRLAGNLHLTFFGADAEAVMANCPGIAMSSGSACSSNTLKQSRVLKAIGMPQEEAECSVRLSIGRFTTDDEVDQAAHEIAEAVNRVRLLTSSAVDRSFEWQRPDATVA
jgi:cysteine desulfurase